MSMKQLQDKIQFLEATIQMDRAELRRQKEFLVFRFREKKKSIVLAQILLGSFTVGYWLAPSKKLTPSKGKKIAALAMFGELKRRFNQFIIHFKTLKKHVTT